MSHEIMKKPKKPIYANSLAELAIVLDVARKTIDRWSKLPGAPRPKADGRHVVAAWRAFIKAHGLKGSDSPGMQALKERRLIAQCETIEHRLAVEKGKYLLADETEQALALYSAEQRGILRQKLENELPSELVGLDQIAIRAKMKSVVDAICAVMMPLVEKTCKDIGLTETKEK